MRRFTAAKTKTREKATLENGSQLAPPGAQCSLECLSSALTLPSYTHADSDRSLAVASSHRCSSRSGSDFRGGAVAATTVTTAASAAAEKLRLAAGKHARQAVKIARVACGSLAAGLGALASRFTIACQVLLEYTEMDDSAKMAYTKMAFFVRPFVP